MEKPDVRILEIGDVIYFAAMARYVIEAASRAATHGRSAA
jgi:hypothetical protein